jgi:recombination protein RecT
MQPERARPGANGEIVRGEKPQKTLADFVLDHQKDFALVLPKHMNPDRLVRLSIGALRTTKGLAQCSLTSFASSIMACSILGLEPNTPLGHAYLLPFKNKGVLECQLIIGYKGLIELMNRSGVVSSVRSIPVFEGDEFEYELGLHSDIRHRPSVDPTRGTDPTKLTHVYPVVKLREQGMDPIWDVLNRGQIEARRNRSPAAKASTSPWITDYIPMALKTGIRQIATWVPSSSERTLPLAQAVAYEEAQERGKSITAVAALGDNAQESLEKMGAYPTTAEEADDELPENVDKTTGEVTG